jgi:hypothetical protein
MANVKFNIKICSTALALGRVCIKYSFKCNLPVNMLLMLAAATGGRKISWNKQI